MVWSPDEKWMVSADKMGIIKYWVDTMTNVKEFNGFDDTEEQQGKPIRELSFSPTTAKFASCSDDGTVRVWDFGRCALEKTLRGAWFSIRTCIGNQPAAHL